MLIVAYNDKMILSLVIVHSFFPCFLFFSEESFVLFPKAF